MVSVRINGKSDGGLVWFGWEEGRCVCVFVCCVLFKDSLNVVMSNLVLRIN